MSTPTAVSNNPILNDAIRASQTVTTEPTTPVSNTSSKMQKLEEMEKELELEKKMLELEKQKAQIANMRQGISNGGYNSVAPMQPNTNLIDENDPVIAAGRSIGSPMSTAMYGYSRSVTQYPAHGNQYQSYRSGYNSTYNRYSYPTGRIIHRR